jgi:hypothetical protein
MLGGFMRALGALALVLLAGVFAPAANAAEAKALARATAVQPPVWIERDGRKEALGAGAVLRANDHISTGAGGRVHIELAEDSIVKLGENADFYIPRLAQAEAGGLFQSTMKVLKGAFRFTTRTLGKQAQREVDVQIGVATAGVRGTDIWGKADAEQDLICLLEGKIEVGTEGKPTQKMDQPGTFFAVPKGKAPLPVRPVPQDRLPGFAAQTEMAEDQVALFADGQYMVLVANYDTREEARAEVSRLSKKGYASEVIEPKTQGYLVVVRGLGSKGEAKRFATHLKRKFGATRASFVPNF